ncbi:MAG: hypothetical protein QG656_2242 [Candidatus Hydrogenedentes bacterium]|nr:hypothetical protein [Candidatus Hydrogenedentota bacterium]
MKRRILILLIMTCAVIAIVLSFKVMGFSRHTFTYSPGNPVRSVAFTGIAFTWFALGLAAYPVWNKGIRMWWLQGLHFGLCCATAIMVLFYRWAYFHKSAGFPFQVCQNFFDGGDRHWIFRGIAIDFVFWCCVFGVPFALLLMLTNYMKMRTTRDLTDDVDRP